MRDECLVQSMTQLLEADGLFGVDRLPVEYMASLIVWKFVHQHGYLFEASVASADCVHSTAASRVCAIYLQLHSKTEEYDLSNLDPIISHPACMSLRRAKT